MSGKIPENFYGNNLKTIRQEEFEAEVKKFHKVLETAIEKEKDDIRRDLIKKIRYHMSVYTREDFEAKVFLWNDGKFRSEAEINAYNREIERKEAVERYNRQMEYDRNYYNSGQFYEESKGGWKCWIPVFIAVILFIICFRNFMENPYADWSYDLGWFLFLTSPILITICLIARCIHARKVERLAEEHHIPANDPVLKKERDTIKGAKLGSVGIAVAAYTALSKAHKEITNPDSWNTFK